MSVEKDIIRLRESHKSLRGHCDRMKREIKVLRNRINALEGQKKPIQKESDSEVLHNVFLKKNVKIEGKYNDYQDDE